VAGVLKPFTFQREAGILLGLVVLVPFAGLVLAILVPSFSRHGSRGADTTVLLMAGVSDETTLKRVVERLGRYVADYGERMSVLVGVEHYEQQIADTGARRSLVSEIAFIPTRGDWLAYRDVFEVDGQKIEGRTGRLQRLLLDWPQDGFDRARQIADESARYNLGDIQRNFNTPTMCLFAMRPANIERFKFKKAGEEQAGEHALWKVRFEEKDRPTIVRSPTGKSLPLTGYVWVRPSDGAVFKTEMEIKADVARPRPGSVSGTEEAPVYAHVSVDYDLDSRLNTILPARMQDVYAGVASGRAGARAMSRVEGVASYSDFKRFETSSRLIISK
jgi:hypothetical protein